MKYFSPDKAAFIQGLREAALTEMQLASSSDILVRLVRYIERTSQEILADRDKLSELQRAGIQRAVMDTTRSVEVMHDLIVDQKLTTEQTENLLFALAKLIDDALEVGFYHALDRKSLRISERIISGGQEGGKKTGLKSQNKAMAWKAIVEEEILRIRQDDPGLSQDKLAERIIDCWKGEKSPGHQSITKHISAFDKAARHALGNEGASDT